MKKKIFLVSALVAMAMSTMFVACNQNAPSTNNEEKEEINGCKCTITWDDGEKDTEKFSLEDMEDYYDVTTCSKLAKVLLSYSEDVDDIKCKEY